MLGGGWTNTKNPCHVGIVSEEAKFRIQSVVDMTGVSAATLRAWERRYGVPSPQRSASSYRLYSQRDIAMVRRINELCQGGMSPSQATRHVASSKEFSPKVEVSQPAPDAFERVSSELIDAVCDFDVARLERGIQRAMFLSSAWLIYHRVFAPTMRRLGDMWHAKQISVAQEHMASEYLERATRSLLRLVAPTDTSHPVLLACFAEELHTLPLYGVAFELARVQAPVLILGARTPDTAIRHAVESLAPTAVALSATVAPPPERARQLAKGYADAVADVPWIVGGAGAETMRHTIEREGGVVGDYRRLRQLVIQARRGVK